jgi:ankyrin repeat protein
MIKLVPRLNLDKGDKYKRTALLMACRNGHAKIVALLMKHHASAGLPDTSGNTPLHHAAAYGWIECVKLLLEHGPQDEVSPSAENAWKATPMTIALQKNHLTIVKELLATQDINVNSKDDNGRSLLSLALGTINHESIELIDQLLHQKNPADVNSQDAKGQTPLYHLIEGMLLRKKSEKGMLFGDDEL